MLIFDRANSSRRPRLGLAHKKKAGRRRRFTPGVDALELRALLSTFTVTNANDSGPGSLRQQILVAPAGSTIRFANALKGQTIVLSTGALSVNKNVDIEGPGASQLSVSGGGLSQVIDVAAGTTVTIAGLTITGGVDNDGIGGGIMNAGNLTLKNDSVTGNLASSGVAFSDAQGGGIYNTGNLILDHTAVTSNQANSSQEELAVEGSRMRRRHACDQAQRRLEQSSARSAGTFAQGGGIDNQVGASVTIDTSTISGNSAVGGPGILFSLAKRASAAQSIALAR